MFQLVLFFGREIDPFKYRLLNAREVLCYSNTSGLLLSMFLLMTKTQALCSKNVLQVIEKIFHICWAGLRKNGLFQLRFYINPSFGLSAHTHTHTFLHTLTHTHAHVDIDMRNDEDPLAEARLSKPTPLGQKISSENKCRQSLRNCTNQQYTLRAAQKPP